MHPLPHRDEESERLTLSLEVPVSLLRTIEGVQELARMPVRDLLTGYLEGCLREFGKPAWDSEVIDEMSDEQLEEAIEEMESELEARVAAGGEELEIEAP